MGILSHKLLLTSGQGRLFLYDIESGDFRVVFEAQNPNEYFMGVSRHQNRIFVGSNYLIYELRPTNKEWVCVNSLSFFPIENRGYSPKIQHIKVIDDKLFVPARASNSVFVLKLDSVFNLYIDISFKPSMSMTDYDNIVDIFFHDNIFYFCFNKVAEEPTVGGIAITNKKFNLIEQNYYGWDCYNYSIVDRDVYLLCNKVGDKKAGLVCNNSLKIVYDNLYCMDYSINDDMIILVGSAININNTNMSGGIILLFDRAFKQLSDPIFMQGSGQFMGCMLMANDRTDDLWLESLAEVDFTAKEDGRVRIRDLTKTGSTIKRSYE